MAIVNIPIRSSFLNTNGNKPAWKHSSPDTTNLLPGEVLLRAQKIGRDEGLPWLYRCHKSIETQEHHSPIPLPGLAGFHLRTVSRTHRQPCIFLHIFVFRRKSLEINLFVAPSCRVTCFHRVSWFLCDFRGESFSSVRFPNFEGCSKTPRQTSVWDWKQWS